ncbi:MAG: hypothetical protein ABW185_14435 [Sedimenticola sp.]
MTRKKMTLNRPPTSLRRSDRTWMNHGSVSTSKDLIKIPARRASRVVDAFGLK